MKRKTQRKMMGKREVTLKRKGLTKVKMTRTRMRTMMTMTRTKMMKMTMEVSAERSGKDMG